MWDWIELWLRKAGGPLLLGLLTMFLAVVEQWWLPMRVLSFLFGVGEVVKCCVETWKLIRGQETAQATLDRLEGADSTTPTSRSGRTRSPAA
ncbi:hypothetical protein [Streptomyces sp. NBC_01353]|uniref:hypothetical protein n=1 Tax=Streptomyces sp. NBC_01353 TaxID=2903835 RepID=UPI002E31D4BC|nr:hypothetical protein [Streptomyces sp. NBC_01353]